jgi:uncharacterized membrane protein
MCDLVVVAYPEENRAAEVMALLRRMSSQYLIDLDDAVYVTKDADGQLTLHQAHNLTGGGAAGGALWGGLIGLLFLAPVAGAAIGAGIGAIAGTFSDYGIDDTFVKELGATIQPESSAIFVLVRHATADKVVPELSKYGGTILRTSLATEAEARLQAALAHGAEERVAAPHAAVE